MKYLEMKRWIFLFCLFSSKIYFSQTVSKRFSDLPCPLKTWVIFHPFKAKKAQQISMEANRVSDSIKKSNLLEGDAASGQVDAFRHAYWMARLKQEIGESAARSLGKSYEKVNELQFKKEKKENGVLPDLPAKQMDLYNNEIGLSLVSKNTKIPKTGLVYRVLNSILAGELKIIKKDKKGNFLTCDNQEILPKEIIQKWENKKCLIPSNQTFE